MKKILVYILMIFGIASVAYACSCIPQSTQEHFNQNDVVFTGKVVNKDSKMLSDYYVVTFEVYKQYKGDVVSKNIEIVTHQSSATCGVNFEEGKEYVVFASDADGELMTGLCSGTSDLEYAQETVNELEYIKNNGSIPVVENDYNVVVNYNKEDYTINYSLKVMLPNPCYKVEVEERLLESYPLQVVSNVELIKPAEDVMCAQVIEEKVIEQSISPNAPVGSFIIMIDGKEIHAEEFVNDIDNSNNQNINNTNNTGNETQVPNNEEKSFFSSLIEWFKNLF